MSEPLPILLYELLKSVGTALMSFGVAVAVIRNSIDLSTLEGRLLGIGAVALGIGACIHQFWGAQ